MHVSAGGAVDAHHAADLEDFANPVEHLVLLFRQRLALLGGRRLREQFFGRRCAGTGGQGFGQVIGQLNEVFIGGHRCALAKQFHHRADLLVGTEVETEASEGGFAIASLVGQLLTAFSQDFDRLLFVATGFLQGLLAIHQWQSGSLAECLHRCCRDFGHLFFSKLKVDNSLFVSSPLRGRLMTHGSRAGNVLLALP